MDLQTRKLDFIKQFLKLQSEDTIARLEKILKKSLHEDSGDTAPMSMEELNARIDQSLQDSKEGKVIEVNQLLLEIEKWG